MFNIGMVELLILLAVALIVVGPQDLPKVARWLARALRNMRNMIQEFSSELNIEEDIKEIRKAGDLLKESVREINPVTELTDEIEKIQEASLAELKNLTDLPDALKNELSGSVWGQEKKTAPATGQSDSLGG
jgi:sec-independent protein translocase protein TatB